MIEFAIVLCIKNIQDLNANKSHTMGRPFHAKSDLTKSNSRNRTLGIERKRRNVRKPRNIWNRKFDGIEPTEVMENGKSGTSKLNRLSTCQKFDYMSLIIFILSYFIFNIAYFIHFMNIQEWFELLIQFLLHSIFMIPSHFQNYG